MTSNCRNFGPAAEFARDSISTPRLPIWLPVPHLGNDAACQPCARVSACHAHFYRVASRPRRSYARPVWSQDRPYPCTACCEMLCRRRIRRPASASYGTLPSLRWRRSDRDDVSTICCFRRLTGGTHVGCHNSRLLGRVATGRWAVSFSAVTFSFHPQSFFRWLARPGCPGRGVASAADPTIIYFLPQCHLPHWASLSCQKLSPTCLNDIVADICRIIL